MNWLYAILVSLILIVLILASRWPINARRRWVTKAKQRKEVQLQAQLEYKNAAAGMEQLTKLCKDTEWRTASMLRSVKGEAANKLQHALEKLRSSITLTESAYQEHLADPLANSYTKNSLDGYTTSLSIWESMSAMIRETNRVSEALATMNKVAEGKRQDAFSLIQAMNTDIELTRIAEQKLVAQGYRPVATLTLQSLRDQHGLAKNYIDDQFFTEAVEILEAIEVTVAEVATKIDGVPLRKQELENLLDELIAEQSDHLALGRIATNAQRAAHDAYHPSCSEAANQLLAQAHEQAERAIAQIGAARLSFVNQDWDACEDELATAQQIYADTDAKRNEALAIYRRVDYLDSTALAIADLLWAKLDSALDSVGGYRGDQTAHQSDLGRLSASIAEIKNMLKEPQPKYLEIDAKSDEIGAEIERILTAAKRIDNNCKDVGRMRV